MKKYAISPEGCMDHLTPSKKYEILKEDIHGFEFLDDDEVNRYASFINSRHLNGQDWKIVEEEEEKYLIYSIKDEGYFLTPGSGLTKDLNNAHRHSKEDAVQIVKGCKNLKIIKESNAMKEQEKKVDTKGTVTATDPVLNTDYITGKKPIDKLKKAIEEYEEETGTKVNIKVKIR